MNKFGVIDELYTPIREYDYAIVCGAAGASDAEFPEKFELDHELCGEVYNQIGETCVAYVIAQLAENYYKEKMSKGYIYGRFRAATTSGDGLVVSTAMDMWNKLGTVKESVFDLIKDMPEMKEIVNELPELDQYAKEYPLKGYTAMNYADRDRKDRMIKDALMKQANGEIKGYGLLAASNKGFQGGSHCIMITGWDDTKDCYIIKNSWGKSYGTDGYYRLPKEKTNAVYLPLFDDIKLPFEDIDENGWYFKNLKNLYCSGMVNGRSETIAAPNDYITRAEVWALIDRLAGRTDDRFIIQDRVNKEKFDDIMSKFR